jgi:hypothetical protein
MAKDMSAGKSGGTGKAASDTRSEEGFERRSFVTRGIAELVPGLTRAAYKKRSPAGAMLMSEWASIVGPRLAEETEPRRLSGTQLTIACSGPIAMELQHLSGTLMERINTHAGRPLVERLRFVQSPVAGPRLPLARRQVVAPEPVAGLEPGALNDALARLRAAIRER